MGPTTRQSRSPADDRGACRPDSRPARPDINAASCAESYSPARVAERAFAFDGTITTIGPGRTRKQPATGVSARRAVTFHVNEWFTGGTGNTAVVDMTQPTLLPGHHERMLPTYAVGTRLLVTGEPDSRRCGPTRQLAPGTQRGVGQA